MCDDFAQLLLIEFDRQAFGRIVHIWDDKSPRTVFVLFALSPASCLANKTWVARWAVVEKSRRKETQKNGLITKSFLVVNCFAE